AGYTAESVSVAIICDNLVYGLIGRLGELALLARWAWLYRYASRVLPRVEAFMQRHGGKAVFFGRFISILRFTAAWIAGLTGMAWGRFLFWNAAGGIIWATAVGLAAYYGGQTGAAAISRYGLYGAALVAVGVVAVALVLRLAHRRVV